MVTGDPFVDLWNVPCGQRSNHLESDSRMAAEPGTSPRARRLALLALLAVTLAATASACGGGGSSFEETTAPTVAPPAPAPPTSTIAEGALDLAVPPGVFSANVLARFTRASGCVVAVQPWSTSSNAAAAGLRRLRGSLDLVAVRADSVHALAGSALLAPLGTGAIDGYGQITGELRSLQSDRLDGHTYAVPYAWEPIALLSRDDAFPDGPPASLRTLWEPGRRASAALPDDPLTLATASLSVGVDDPFALDAADLSASYELVRLAAITQRFGSDAALEALMRSGSVTLALGSPRVALALRGTPAVTATVPSEGAVGLAGTLALAVRAPHPVCAYRFLSYMLEPQVQAAIASVAQLTPAVPAACRSLGRRACASLHAQDQWSNGGDIQFARRPLPPAEPWSAWQADWRRLGGT
jgi:putative spermidine/putrescine transport system substrate-binding protein